MSEQELPDEASCVNNLCDKATKICCPFTIPGRLETSDMEDLWEENTNENTISSTWEKGLRSEMKYLLYSDNLHLPKLLWSLNETGQLEIVMKNLCYR